MKRPVVFGLIGMVLLSLIAVVLLGSNALFASASSGRLLPAAHSTDNVTNTDSPQKPLNSTDSSTPKDAKRLSQLATAAGNTLTIAAGQTVLWDKDIAIAHVEIQGKLICDSTKNLNLTAQSIMLDGGQLSCGTEKAPYTKRAVITLTGARSTTNLMSCGTKVLCVMSGGKLDLHGIPYNVSWTNLAQTALPGATTLSLMQTVNWPAGSHIVVAASGSRIEESEEAVVKSVNGTNVTLNGGLKYRHDSVEETFGNKTIKERAEVGLLSHNILIQGDQGSEKDNFGAHVMIHKTGSAYVSGVELYRVGQRSVLGRYPFHWHDVEDATGQYIKQSSVHHSYHRFITVHATSNATVADNVAYDGYGNGFYLENGNEVHNSLIHNLGILVHALLDSESTAPIVDNSPSLSNNKKSDFIPAVFYLINPNNILKDNVAVGADNGLGFWYDAHAKCPDSAPAFCGKAYTGSGVAGAPFGVFQGNVAHSMSKTEYWRTDYTVHGSALYTTNYTGDPGRFIFQNFTAYNNDGKAVVVAGKVIGGRFANHEWLNHLAVQLEDTLVVGKSSIFNIRTGADEVRGLAFGWNGGAITAKNVTFANFGAGDAAALFWRQGESNMNVDNADGVNIPSVEKLDFINVVHRISMNPKEHKTASSNFGIFDLDGSLTGYARGSAVFNNPISVTSACKRFADLAVAFCPYSVTLIDYTGMKRDDGASQTQHEGWFYSTAVVPGHTYTFWEKRRFMVFGTVEGQSLTVCLPNTSTATINGLAAKVTKGCIQITFTKSMQKTYFASAPNYVAKIEVN